MIRGRPASLHEVATHPARSKVDHFVECLRQAIASWSARGDELRFHPEALLDCSLDHACELATVVGPHQNRRFDLVVEADQDALHVLDAFFVFIQVESPEPLAEMVEFSAT